MSRIPSDLAIIKKRLFHNPITTILGGLGSVCLALTTVYPMASVASAVCFAILHALSLDPKDGE